MDAFEAFFDREYARVHRSLVTALGDVAAADDAAQEAFVKAWLRWGHVQQADRPASWVYVVAVRRALRLRGRLREDLVEVVPMNGIDDGFAEIVVGSVDAARMLRRLTERQRLVVVLRFYADLRLQEIADAIGTSVGTVKSTLHDALRRLQVEVPRETEVFDGFR